MSFKGNYEENVFVNYPLDTDYLPIFRAIIFAIQANGFYPICSASEVGGEPRFKKICKMINCCKYAVHDLSMVDFDINTGLPRFNMAFELGLFIGCNQYGEMKHKQKKYLVLDDTPHQTKMTLSDLDFIDTEGHNNDRLTALRKVNSWLCQIKNIDVIGNAWIVNTYRKYERFFPDLCDRLGVDQENPEIRDELLLSGKFLETEQKNIK